MKPLILICITIYLTGCSQPLVWQHPNMSAMNFEGDLAFCQYEAQKALASYTGTPDPGRDGHRTSIVSLFNLFEYDNRKKSIIRSCMQLKGYYLVPLKEEEPPP